MDLTFTLFSLLCLLMTHTSEGTRISINKRVLPFLNRIFLRCQDNIGQDLTNTVQFYRTIHTTGNQTVTQLFTNYSLDDISVAMFYVTPETEGVYTCLDTLTNETSSNNITLVASPVLESSFTLPQVTTAQIGLSSLPLYCGFKAGALSEYTETEWWRGVVKLDVNGSKFELLPNFTLVVHNVQLTDVSSGYYCNIKVYNPEENVAYNNSSPDVGLQVYNDLATESSLQDGIFHTPTSPTFNCTAHGVPRPLISWLIKGSSPGSNPRYVVEEQQLTLGSAVYTVTSTLTISDTIPNDTGNIQCVVYQSGQNGLLTNVHTANIIVLYGNTVPQLYVNSDNQLVLSISFQTTIAGLFALKIRYIRDNSDYYETVLTSSNFINTNSIDNYVIPNVQLPSFSSFRAQIALLALGTAGPFSPLSSLITIITNSPSSTTTALQPTSTVAYVTTTVPTTTVSPTSIGSCDCTSNNISLYIIIGLLAVVLVLVLVCVGIIALYFCCRTRSSSYSTSKMDPDPNATYELPSRRYKEDEGGPRYSQTPVTTSITSSYRTSSYRSDTVTSTEQSHKDNPLSYSSRTTVSNNADPAASMPLYENSLTVISLEDSIKAANKQNRPPADYNYTNIEDIVKNEAGMDVSTATELPQNESKTLNDETQKDEGTVSILPPDLHTTVLAEVEPQMLQERLEEFEVSYETRSAQTSLRSNMVPSFSQISNPEAVKEQLEKEKKQQEDDELLKEWDML